MNVVATIRPAVIKLCSCLHQQILNDIPDHLEFISLVEEEIGASSIQLADIPANWHSSR